MPEPQTANTEPPSTPPVAAVAKKSKLLVVVPIVLVLVLGSAAGIWFFRSRSHPAETNKAPQVEQVKATLHLESFVINLADPEQKAYLRIGIDIGLANEQKGKEGEAGPPVAMVRDTIVGVLGLCKPDDLLTAEGKAKLKSDLLQALQQRAPSLGAQEIYFTEFLIQR